MTQRTAKVNALDHGLRILRMYRADGEILTISEMARRLDVHRSTASRLAATLYDSGFLSLDGQPGHYRLGRELIRLGSLARQASNVVDAALKHLRDLCELSGETGHIGLLDGVESVTAAAVDGWQTIRMHHHVGRRSPAHCSSLGKCLLSNRSAAELRDLFHEERLESRTPNTIATVTDLEKELENVRENGFALDNEELEPGLCCVSAPIRDDTGRVVAALGLSGPASRLTGPALLRLSADVRRAAALATADIGGHPSPTP
nr:IclR family transcriptional regulator [Micromonospora sp. DSM 115978]